MKSHLLGRSISAITVVHKYEPVVWARSPRRSAREVFMKAVKGVVRGAHRAIANNFWSSCSYRKLGLGDACLRRCDCQDRLRPACEASSGAQTALARLRAPTDTRMDSTQLSPSWKILPAEICRRGDCRFAGSSIPTMLKISWDVAGTCLCT